MNASILFYLIFLYNISHHESYLQLFVCMCFQSFCVFCIQLLSHPQYSLILDCKSWCNCQQWKFYNKKCENIKKESSSSMRLKAKLLLLFPVISYINSYFFLSLFLLLLLLLFVYYYYWEEISGEVEKYCCSFVVAFFLLLFNI